MNCHGEQIKKYLEQIDFIRDNYIITHVITYSNLTNSVALDQLKDCDILIINNLKEYKNYTVQNWKTVIKPGTQIIVIEYFRFNGFNPLKGFICNQIMCFDESYNVDSYNNYINYPIDESIIKNNFNESLKKLKQIDDMSDIKIYDYFVENYKTIPMFRDYGHPTKYIFKHMIDQILVKLNIDESIDITDDKLEFGIAVRYNIINENVKRVLGLEYKIDKIYAFDDLCTEEQYFYFTKSLQQFKKLSWEAIFKKYHLYLKLI
jgi:hypothetical protein